MTNNSLENKRILISGASGKLGSQLAVELSLLGVELILLSKRKSRLEQVDDAIAQAGGRAPLRVELDDLRAKPEHYTELAQALAEEGLDAAVLCSAAHTGLHPMDHLPQKDWKNIVQSNLNGPFYLLQRLLPLLKISQGKIIGVSDPAAREQKAFWGAYAASKAGFDAVLNICREETEGVVDVCRFEPLPMASAIRNAVYPGEVEKREAALKANSAHIIALLSSVDPIPESLNMRDEPEASEAIH